MTKNTQEFFTVKQTSQILGFSTNSIYKFLQEGRLKGTRGSKKQGRFKIPRKSIDVFLGTPVTDAYIRSKLKTTKTTTVQTTSTSPQPIPPTTPTTTSKPPTHHLPIHFTRSLIIFALIAIIADILISTDFSLIQQLIRISLIAILILITYQFGDQYHQDDTESDSTTSNTPTPVTSITSITQKLS